MQLQNESLLRKRFMLLFAFISMSWNNKLLKKKQYLMAPQYNCFQGYIYTPKHSLSDS